MFVFGDGDGHGDEGEDLEEVALEHVFERADLVEVAAAFFDADGFECGDLDVLDFCTFHHEVEDAVFVTEVEEAFDGVFAEVVVEEVDVFFVEVFADEVEKFFGGFGIFAKGFFED